MCVEDNFRLSLFPDHRACLWSKNAVLTIPRSYTSNHQWLKKYDAHKKILNDSFLETSSLFKLHFDPQFGIGVFSNKTLANTPGNNKMIQDNLHGNYSSFMSDQTWSIVNLLPKKCARGRPKLQDVGKSPTKRNLALLGPINFVNHSCTKHAHIKFFQDVHDKKRVKVKMLKRIKEGQQVHMNYGPKRFQGIKCTECSKKK